MRDFDVLDLVDFAPPDALCEKCMALLRWRGGRGPSGDWGCLRPDGWVCPVCGVRYQESPAHFTLSEYLRSRGLLLFEGSDALGHARKLGGIARELSSGFCSPFEKLVDALAAAAQFVHLLTCRLDDEMRGALALTSRRVPVRGLLVKRCGEGLTAREAGALGDAEGPIREVPFAAALPNAAWSVVVIDGLLAFQGSAGLTAAACRPEETLRAITGAEAVTQLHNLSFAPTWGRLSCLGNAIDTGLPF